MKTNTINPASFVGCADGKWGVQSIKTIIGESLTSTNYIEVYPLILHLKDLNMMLGSCAVLLRTFVIQSDLK